jgi:hypothetical protein
MKTNYKPLAMRCTQEQFDSIKDRITLPIIDIDSFDEYYYLRNDFGGQRAVSNTNVNLDDEIHETFDGELFLDCCGREKKDEINVPADVKDKIIKEYLKDKVWKGSEFIFRYTDCEVWERASARCEFMLKPKPQPDYTAEIEALAKKAKENGQKVIIKFE